MIRPLDIGITIQHAADAQRAAPNSLGRPEVAQQQFADQIDKQVQRQQQQVIKGEQTEKGDVNPDRKGDGSGYQRRKPPNKKSKLAMEAAKNAKPSGESMYDIRI